MNRGAAMSPVIFADLQSDELIEQAEDVLGHPRGQGDKHGGLRRPRACDGTLAHVTRVNWEQYEQTFLFEDMVAVLISRLHPNAERIDGAGGDGGRDLQLRSPGRLDLFELKSFTGRLGARSPNRRRQVEDSLQTGAGLQPDSWTLVVPINFNEAELSWFDGLREKYQFDLDWKGRDWLDDQMSSLSDVRRYYLEGASDEVVRILKELNREEGSLTGGVQDALTRAQALRRRLNDIDPQYRLEILPGPIEAALVAFPGAVMYQQETHPGADSWTISVLAKYRDAVRDRPIQVKTNLVFDETVQSQELRKQYLDMMDYGSPQSVSIQGPPT